MRDYPVAFWPLDETSGTIAYDISGCGNHGTYSGTFKHGLLPIVPGGVEGTLITSTNSITLPVSNNYYGSSVGDSFATNKTSDNDFTVEFWIKINTLDASVPMPILMEDDKNSFGFLYEKGNIYFSVNDANYNEHIAKAYINYTEKSIHVVGIYTNNSIFLYIDGVLSGTKNLPSNFKFYEDENTSITPEIVVQSSSTNTFIIDGIAIYRYALSGQTILSHYLSCNAQIEPFQVSTKNGGYYFDLNGSQLYENYIYSYPSDKNLETFISDTNNTKIYYDSVKRGLTFYESLTGTNTVVLEDYIIVPDEIGVTSKIEWRGGNQVVVETSSDGINYVQCVNGGVIPQYKVGSYATSRDLHIKITMSYSELNTPESSEDYYANPIFSFLSIVFYKNKSIRSKNGGGVLQVSDVSSPVDYTLGTINYPTLSQNYNNGLRVQDSGGFMIPISYNITTVEFFFTPISLNSDCALIHFPDGMNNPFKYSWLANGSISSQNISKIYVNNVEKAGETNISNVFTAGQMHHVVIVLNGVATGNLYFNHLYPSTMAGPKNLYNNLILYSSGLDGSDIDYNYKLWTGAPASIVVNPVISIDEKPVQIDSDDWTVVSST